MLLSQLFITVPQMTSVFWMWSLVAVPVIAALYCIGFLFKRASLEKYYVVPKCAASFLCVGSAVLAVGLAGGQPWRHPLFWALRVLSSGRFFYRIQADCRGIILWYRPLYTDC